MGGGCSFLQLNPLADGVDQCLEVLHLAVEGHFAAGAEDEAAVHCHIQQLIAVSPHFLRRAECHQRGRHVAADDLITLEDLVGLGDVGSAVQLDNAASLGQLLEVGQHGQPVTVTVDNGGDACLVESQDHLLEVGPGELLEHGGGDEGSGGAHGEDGDTVTAGALDAGDAGLDDLGSGGLTGGLHLLGAVVQIAAELAHAAGHGEGIESGSRTGVEHEGDVLGIPELLVLLHFHTAADEALEDLELQEGALEGRILNGGHEGGLPCAEALLHDEIVVGLLHDGLLHELEQGVVVQILTGDAHLHLLNVGNGLGADGESHIGVAGHFAALLVSVHPSVVALEDVLLGHAGRNGGVGAGVGENGDIFAACKGFHAHGMVKFLLAVHNMSPFQ